MRRAVICLIAAGVAAACAARRPAGEGSPAALAHADALVRAGCYFCLTEALAGYEQPAAARRDASLRERIRIFALLAARVRELGLIGAPDWLEQGRTLATALAPGSVEHLFLDVAALVPLPAAAVPGDALDTTQRQYTRLEELQSRVGSQFERLAGNDVVAAYFHRVLTCLPAGPRETPPPPFPHGDIPLLAYRGALCTREPGGNMDALLAKEPRFVEARYFKAMHVFSTGKLLSTEQELDRLEAPFRDMAAAAFLRGQVLLMLEDFAAAATQFDRVLALVPDQPRARFERLRALSYDGQFKAAEQAATAMIETGTWFQGEAHYWRAWNRRQLRHLEDAASDIDTCKRLLFNAAVPKLAGLIALDRNQLDIALYELTTSIERKRDDCDVHFALGQVHARRAVWADAGQAFEQAATCAVNAQAAAEQRLREIARASLDERRRQYLSARAERDRQAAHAREGAAALNAASSFVLASEPALARTWAQRAVAWKEWADRARDLLDKLP